MPSWVIVDSGIYLATVLQETISGKADTLLVDLQGQKLQFAAPLLLRYEFLSVIRKSVHRKILTKEEGEQALKTLQAYAIQYLVDDALLIRGYELATQYNRPAAYDEQYLALAERLNCEFWTADERLYNSFKNDLKWVRWLGDFQTKS